MRRERQTHVELTALLRILLCNGTMHNIRQRSENPSKHIDSETEELAVARGQETSVAERCLFWHNDLDRAHILEQSSMCDLALLDLLHFFLFPVDFPTVPDFTGESV